LKNNYLAKIETLRATAVLSVLIFHLNKDFLPYGYLGVDIFLVISGYLIANMLECKNFNYNALKTFLKRRYFRLFPTLLTILFLNLLVLFFLLPPNEHMKLTNGSLTSALGIANIYFANSINYFYSTFKPPLVHLWTISLEIQFYLFMAFLFFTVKSRKFRLKLIIVLCAISLIFYSIGSIYFSQTTFFLLHTRLWEFLFGSLIFYFSRLPTKSSWIYGALLFSLISLPLISVKSVLPNFVIVFLTGMIISTTNEDLFMKKLNNFFVTKLLAKISYSLYLSHPLIFFMFDGLKQSLIVYGLKLCVSVLFALFIFNLVENRFRYKDSLKKSFTNLLWLPIVGMSVVLPQADAVWLRVMVTHEQSKIYKLISETKIPLSHSLDNVSNCQFGSDKINIVFLESFFNCHQKLGKATLVIGDSHAINLFNIITKNNSKFIVSISGPDCELYKLNCNFDTLNKFILDNYDKISKIFYHQEGSSLISESKNQRNFEILSNYHELVLDQAKLQNITNYLSSWGNYTQVIWLGPFIESRVDLSNAKNWNANLKIDPNVVRNFRLLNVKLDSSVSGEFIEFRDISRYIKVEEFKLFVNSCSVWRDSDHFSTCGEDIIAAESKEWIDELLNLD